MRTKESINLKNYRKLFEKDFLSSHESTIQKLPLILMLPFLRLKKIVFFSHLRGLFCLMRFVGCLLGIKTCIPVLVAHYYVCKSKLYRTFFAKRKQEWQICFPESIKVFQTTPSNRDNKQLNTNQLLY